MKTLGQHLMLELWGCRNLSSVEVARAALLEAAQACHVTVRQVDVWPWEPHGGISAMAILAESHLSLHTWPEHGYAAVDLFTCGAHTTPDAALPVFERVFTPERMQVMRVERGLMMAPPRVLPKTG